MRGDGQTRENAQQKLSPFKGKKKKKLELLLFVCPRQQKLVYPSGLVCSGSALVHFNIKGVFHTRYLKTVYAGRRQLAAFFLVECVPFDSVIFTLLTGERCVQRFLLPRV